MNRETNPGLVFKVAFGAKTPSAPRIARGSRPRLETRPPPTTPTSSLPAIERIGRLAQQKTRRRLTRARLVGGTSRLARMLALAHRVERGIEDGELRDLAEAAKRLGISRPRMTQVFRLSSLAPAIQEAILESRLDFTERELRPIAQELAWLRQEQRLSRSGR